MPFGEQDAETEVIVGDAPAVTATVVVPDFAVFWLEVAVIVTVPPTGTVLGAVKTPVEEMLPALVVQVTAEL